MNDPLPLEPPTAWIVTPPDASGFRIFGLSGEERLARSLAAAGCHDVRTVTASAPPEAPSDRQVVLVRADAVFDDRLVSALTRARDTLLVSPGGEGAPVGACVPARCTPEVLAALASPSRSERVTSVRRVTPDALVSPYDANLRKSEAPYLLDRVDPSDASAIEERVFRGSYKGLTDLVTRWVWPSPALAVVRVLAARRIHPNTVTIASFALTLYAFFAFAGGAYVPGLIAAWAMTFLDTVDGKLARCTLTSSRLGNVLDHGLDLVHPPFWWFAWGVGLSDAQPVATAVVVGGYFAGRILEGLFLAVFRFETHSWRSLDGLFRTITARRNPNLLLLSVGTLGGRPDLGLVMVALWTCVSLVFHGARLGQALAARAHGDDVRPWDEASNAVLRPIPSTPA